MVMVVVLTLIITIAILLVALTGGSGGSGTAGSYGLGLGDSYVLGLAIALATTATTASSDGGGRDFNEGNCFSSSRMQGGGFLSAASLVVGVGIRGLSGSHSVHISSSAVDSGSENAGGGARAHGVSHGHVIASTLVGDASAERRRVRDRDAGRSARGSSTGGGRARGHNARGSDGRGSSARGRNNRGRGRGSISARGLNRDRVHGASDSGQSRRVAGDNAADAVDTTSMVLSLTDGGETRNESDGQLVEQHGV